MKKNKYKKKIYKRKIYKKKIILNYNKKFYLKKKVNNYLYFINKKTKKGVFLKKPTPKEILYPFFFNTKLIYEYFKNF